MKKRKIVLLSLVVMMLFACCSACAESVTLIMYMCGSNLQDNCMDDLNEMIAANTGENVNIVVLAGGSTSWPDKSLQADRCNLFTIGSNGHSEIEDWGRSNMGDPETLRKYLEYALDTYPADRTMLVFWNHGGGSEAGVCFDSVYDNEGLKIKEIEDTFKELSETRDLHFDIVGFDACLMAGYEVAAMLTPYAGYMVGSEELEPGLGWNYTPWLAALEENPTMSTEDVCKGIVSSYQEACEASNPNDYYTMSAIRLDAMPRLIENVENLSVYLSDALINKQLKTLSRMRQRVRSYGYWYDSASDMIDISSFLYICKQFAPEATAAARSAYKDVILCNYKSDAVEAASGMSIYVPKDTSSKIRSIVGGYAISALPKLTDFVVNYAMMLNSGDYVFTVGAPEILNRAEIITEAFADSISQFDSIPAATYNAEAGSNGNFFSNILNSQQVAEQQTETSGSDNFFGNILAQQQSEQTAPQTGDSFFGQLISNGSTAQEDAPEVTEDSLGFSITLSDEDMQHLSYAEGSLMIDMTDEELVMYLDFGYLDDTWIDWENNTVYSLFDGKWPALDGNFIAIYDQSVTESLRNRLIPVKLNGEETYLVVSFEANAEVGTILGCNAGYDSDGLPIRDMTQLQEGDVIVPIYKAYYSTTPDADDFEEVDVDGDEIIWHDSMQIAYQSLIFPDDPLNYQFRFILNDIFGDYQVTDFAAFSM